MVSGVRVGVNDGPGGVRPTAQERGEWRRNGRKTVGGGDGEGREFERSNCLSRKFTTSASV